MHDGWKTGGTGTPRRLHNWLHSWRLAYRLHPWSAR
jgi:hypothetical protein